MSAKIIDIASVAICGVSFYRLTGSLSPTQYAKADQQKVNTDMESRHKTLKNSKHDLSHKKAP